MQYLPTEEEDFILQEVKDGTSVNLFSLLIQDGSYVSDTPSDWINDFENCHQIDNVFTNIVDDNSSHSPIEHTKPPKFEDSPFEGWGTHQEVEELQLPLMVMLGPHDPDEIPELSQIRVLEIMVFALHSPLNIIMLDAGLSWKSFDSSDVSPRISFHPLSTDTR